MLKVLRPLKWDVTCHIFTLISFQTEPHHKKVPPLLGTTAKVEINFPDFFWVSNGRLQLDRSITLCKWLITPHLFEIALCYAYLARACLSYNKINVLNNTIKIGLNVYIKHVFIFLSHVLVNSALLLEVLNLYHHFQCTILCCILK